MQRRLMIMRHAKSTWSSDVPTDHGRPLNNRGRRDAPRVGKRLAKLGWVFMGWVAANPDGAGPTDGNNKAA